ncbi:MAG: stage II sporulation protein P [Oscillospiraceae bacterium]
MSVSRKSKLRFGMNILAAGTALALAPLMILSLCSAAPSAEEAILVAAAASARLSAGNVFEPSEKISAEASCETSSEGADKPELPAYIMLDESVMLSRGELIIPSGENEDIVVPKEHDVGAEPYPEMLEAHDGVIKAMTYGFYNGDGYVNLGGGGQVRNCSGVPNETLLEESRKAYDFTVEADGSPQVLIMHTHETESYEPYTRDFYDSSFTSRTTDDEKNMAAVGDAIAAELEKNGIGVIHDVTKHDYPSYNGSYDRSRKTVQAILEENPTIKAVLDIHRDAIEREDGTRIAPTVTIDGKNAAQVMIISCCDDGSGRLTDYMSNFRFASALQQQLETDFGGITRPILFDDRFYNQDLTSGSILIEVGGHANSIDEAVYSGELIGKSLSNLFLHNN